MEVKSYGDVVPLEPSLKHLWEKVRAAADRITQLQEENREFKRQMEELGQELVRLRSDLGQREQEAKRMKQEHALLAGSQGGNNVLTADERDALKTRIKDLIAKINSHL